MLIKSLCIVVYEYELSKSLNAYPIFKNELCRGLTILQKYNTICSYK